MGRKESPEVVVLSVEQDNFEQQSESFLRAYGQQGTAGCWASIELVWYGRGPDAVLAGGC